MNLIIKRGFRKVLEVKNIHIEGKRDVVMMNNNPYEMDIIINATLSLVVGMVGHNLKESIQNKLITKAEAKKEIKKMVKTIEEDILERIGGK